MRREWEWLQRGAALALAAGLALAGCERLAGTEVGNPELTVSARFALLDTSATSDVAAMNMKVMGMGWSMADKPADSGVCWNAPQGKMVDFAADKQAPLDPVKVPAGAWSKAEMILYSPPYPAAAPDTGDYAAWDNPRYARFTRVEGGDTLRALFDLTQALHVKLMFNQARLERWHVGDSMLVKILFDVGRWSQGVKPAGGWTERRDGKHARYVLFSAEENTAGWEALKARLPDAFSSDTAKFDK